MKVLFIESVPKVGKKDEVKNVQDGYARNYLLPQKKAIIATPEVLARIERAKKEAKAEKEIQQDLFRKNIEAVRGLGVTISAKANEKGHLFKAIHAKDIVEALEKEHHVVIPLECVLLPEPIKEVGEYLVSVEALEVQEKIQVVIT